MIEKKRIIKLKNTIYKCDIFIKNDEIFQKNIIKNYLYYFN